MLHHSCARACARGSILLRQQWGKPRRRNGGRSGSAWRVGRVQLRQRGRVRQRRSARWGLFRYILSRLHCARWGFRGLWPVVHDLVPLAWSRWLARSSELWAQQETERVQSRDEVRRWTALRRDALMSSIVCHQPAPVASSSLTICKSWTRLGQGCEPARRSLLSSFPAYFPHVLNLRVIQHDGQGK